MDELEALLAGRHADPHRVLGLHRTNSGVVIRALRPHARRVVAHLGGERVELTEHGNGLFEAHHEASRTGRLDLQAHYADDVVTEGPDAYGFLPTLGEVDLHLVGEGRHRRLDDALGARPGTYEDVAGTAFSVWAPAALAVSVVGDFNAWNPIEHPMRQLGSSGVWELFVPGLKVGAKYKFSLLTRDGHRRLKADPVARAAEIRPATASIVWQSGYAWGDTEWRRAVASRQMWRSPISIYEVHLASWRHGLDYRQLARQLAEYVTDLGFTHVELMPVMEHPLDASWGYQVTGFYAPTSRFGDPDDFKFLVDTLHQHGIGVILDWVPAHFPRDEWALARFDGTALYEHESETRGAHPDWGTLVFNHGRNEVRNFLIASAGCWLDRYHADGLRVDAVASMLYLDYSRGPGQWSPNVYGGREDLEAIAFLKELNETLYEDHPHTMMIAEESTSWPGVSRPVSAGGLGFGFKWNMGWMHDTLEYFSHDPVHRRFHHNELTFSAIYAFSENFVLPLSHDEVVHGKASLLEKMPGDRWQKFANLRALYGYMWAHPGKKLLFMGGEFAQVQEWSHWRSLDWELLADHEHASVRTLVQELNRAYRNEPALWELDTDPAGFSWIEGGDYLQNVISFVRYAQDKQRCLVCVCNLSPVVRYRYRIGMPAAGRWREILNTDSSFYGGSNVGNAGWVNALEEPSHGHSHSALLVLPPLATIWLVPERD